MQNTFRRGLYSILIYILSVVLPDYQLVIILNTVPLMSLIGISLTDFYLQNIHPCYLHLAANHTLQATMSIPKTAYYVMIGLLAVTSLAYSTANSSEDMQRNFLKAVLWSECLCSSKIRVKMLTPKVMIVGEAILPHDGISGLF